MITLKNIYFNKEMPLWTAKDAEDVAKRLRLIEGFNELLSNVVDRAVMNQAASLG
jgi:hypothetical protein